MIFLIPGGWIPPELDVLLCTAVIFIGAAKDKILREVPWKSRALSDPAVFPAPLSAGISFGRTKICIVLQWHFKKTRTDINGGTNTLQLDSIIASLDTHTDTDTHINASVFT